MDQFGLYPCGNHVTDKPEILFARMDIKEVMEKVEAMQAASAVGTAQEGTGEETGADAPEVIDIEAKQEIDVYKRQADRPVTVLYVSVNR